MGQFSIGNVCTKKNHDQSHELKLLMILPRTEIDHVSIRKRFWTDQFWKNSIPPRGHWFDLEKYHGTMVYCICSMHKNEFVSSITTLTKSPNIVVRVLVLLWIFYLYNIISWYIIVIIAPVKIDVIPWCGQENGIVYTYNIYNYIVVYIHIIKGGKSPDKSGFRNTKYLALIKGEWVRSFTETSQWYCRKMKKKFIFYVAFNFQHIQFHWPWKNVKLVTTR